MKDHVLLALLVALLPLALRLLGAVLMWLDRRTSKSTHGVSE